MKGYFLKLLPLCLLAFVLVSSCKKNGPCEAVITVTDSTGKHISGAIVVLRQDSVINPTNGTQGAIFETGLTNSGGQATFTFKLEAVLIVEAQRGNLTARDYVRLEQSETVSKTVIIR